MEKPAAEYVEDAEEDAEGVARFEKAWSLLEGSREVTKLFIISRHILRHLFYEY